VIALDTERYHQNNRQGEKDINFAALHSIAEARKTCILQSIPMIHNQDSFHDLEEILRSLQEYSGDKVTPSDDSTKGLEKHSVDTTSEEVPTAKRNERVNAVDILMEILLQQKLHTSKEYTLGGLRFRVYVLDDTEL